ncbi:MAG: cyclic lactone autoinducer peptide [Ruminiclostridium sp.]|nr:cyclic lactone autoinducer peptide [Ruminiclostridium sp.]
MLKLVTKSRRFLLSVVSAFALIAGASSASAATVIFIHQPKCPQHLLK